MAPFLGFNQPVVLQEELGERNPSMSEPARLKPMLLRVSCASPLPVRKGLECVDLVPGGVLDTLSPRQNTEHDCVVNHSHHIICWISDLIYLLTESLGLCHPLPISPIHFSVSTCQWYCTMQYLSFLVCFISLSIMPSRLIHLVANERVSFFFF